MKSRACVQHTKINKKFKIHNKFHNEQGLPSLDTHKDDGFVRKKGSDAQRASRNRKHKSLALVRRRARLQGRCTKMNGMKLSYSKTTRSDFGRFGLKLENLYFSNLNHKKVREFGDRNESVSGT